MSHKQAKRIRQHLRGCLELLPHVQAMIVPDGLVQPANKPGIQVINHPLSLRALIRAGKKRLTA